MKPITFAIVGAGWRAEFYLRVAASRPDLFTVAGVVVRDPQKERRVAERWGFPVYRDLGALFSATRVDFVVSSVPRSANPEVIRTCIAADVPVLSETPPAADVEGMTQLCADVTAANGRVQVAEQYWLQPHQAARLEVARRGLLGPVSHAQVSVAHGYHGVSLIRRFLGIGYQDATITARTLKSSIVKGPGRSGPPIAQEIGEQSQTIAVLEFDSGPTGVFDFTGSQYFGWIRSERVLVRGERGELVNDELRWLPSFDRPARAPLVRQATGVGSDLDGFHLKGYTLGADWIYDNPLTPARLSDEEIAVGSCLLRMGAYAAGGEPFYPLEEACQDHYFGILIDRAAAEQSTIRSEQQRWAR